MQALLLAAGRSKRFFPLADKNFIWLGGQTLVERQVAHLQQAGIKKIILVGGQHNLKKLKQLFPGVDLVEQKKLEDGMAGAVLAAKRFLDQPTLIISNNDYFEPTAIKKVWSALKVKSVSGALLAKKVEQYFPGGYLKVDAGRIIKIVEKPTPGREPSQLVNLVCHAFANPKKLVQAIEKLGPLGDDGYERALDKILQEEKFIAVEWSGAWQAVKYPWHVLDLNQLFLSTLKKKIAKGAQIAKTAVITGPVVIGSGVKILDYAVIKGPVYLGENCVIGTHALVRDSSIGPGSVVGSSSEVARSYLGSGVWLHRNYVGDSILSDNVSLGSGVVTGNLRLDELEINSLVQNKKISTQKTKFGCVIGENCRVGVNTSFMPGVLVGGDSLIGSGLVIGENIVNKSFVNKKDCLVVKINRVDIKTRDLF